MKRITSRHHPLVATCRALARGREPGERRLLLDGLHLAAEALAAGLRIDTAAATDRTATTDEGRALIEALDRQGAEILLVSDAVMAALSPVTTPSGLVTLADRPTHDWASLLGGARPLLLVACDIQDPGNVGALLRAAEAGGATAAVFCGGSADPYGWKALRGSMGSALRLPLTAGSDVREVMAQAHDRGIRLLATVPRHGTSLYEADLTGPVALVLGGEGPGLSDQVLALADERLTIPMRPPVESLNVAVAAALFVFEAARQRGSWGRTRLQDTQGAPR